LVIKKYTLHHLVFSLLSSSSGEGDGSAVAWRAAASDAFILLHLKTFAGAK
jgi:hypothetical protein